MCVLVYLCGSRTEQSWSSPPRTPRPEKKTHFKHEKKLIQLQHSYIKRLKAIITQTCDSQNKNT